MMNRSVNGQSAALLRESLIPGDGGVSGESVDLMRVKNRDFDC
jgi:hypothetical protein